MESTFKISEEQRKAVLELFDNIQASFKKMWDALKEAADAIASMFIKYVESFKRIESVKRKKRLNKMKVRNIILFFKRITIHRCRNNC